MILGKKNFHFYFVLLSWQATVVNLDLTCFCLLASFKLAHIFDVVVMTLHQKSSSSHPSPCQRCKGSADLAVPPQWHRHGAGPCSRNADTVKECSVTLVRKMLGTRWIMWGSVWQTPDWNLTLLHTWEYQGLYQRGPENRKLERKMISDIDWACPDLGHLGGYFCVIYVLRLLISSSIYLVTALVVFR